MPFSIRLRWSRAHAPGTLNNQMTHMIKVSICIRSHRTAHTPNEGAVGLSAVVHEATTLLYPFRLPM